MEAEGLVEGLVKVVPRTSEAAYLDGPRRFQIPEGNDPE